MDSDDKDAGRLNLFDRLADRIASGLAGILGDVKPSEVFKTVEAREGRVVLGAVSIERAGGFGFGAGEGLDSANNEATGGGGGAGGWGHARPIAIVVVEESGVKVWPVIDYVKLAIVTVGALAAIWKAGR